MARPGLAKLSVPAYRFCRTDDLPALVAAYDTCYRPHFADLEPLTLDGIKLLVLELDLWASSCMIASDGGDPIAVLLAAKRETENLIYRVGVRPGYELKEHGRHLLESLSRKMAILEPTRMRAEVRASWQGPLRFLEACGYRRETTYTDFVRGASPEGQASPLVEPVPVAELLASGVLRFPATCPWERSRETLQNRQARLAGLAVVSDVRVEAYVVFDPDPREERTVVWGLGCEPDAPAEPLLRALLASLPGARDRLVVLARLTAAEVDSGLLGRLGFAAAEEWVALASEAKAG